MHSKEAESHPIRSRGIDTPPSERRSSAFSQREGGWRARWRESPAGGRYGYVGTQRGMTVSLRRRRRRRIFAGVRVHRSFSRARDDKPKQQKDHQLAPQWCRRTVRAHCHLVASIRALHSIRRECVIVRL